MSSCLKIKKFFGCIVPNTTDVNAPRQSSADSQPSSRCSSRTHSWQTDTSNDTLDDRTAIQMFLAGQAASDDSDDSIDILSANGRAITLAGWNDDLDQRCVVRVSEYKPRLHGRALTAADIAGPKQSAERIMAFGEFLTENHPDVGLVPVAQRPRVVANRFLVESYDEIVSGQDDDEERLDFHSYMVKQVGGTDARRVFMYLHDVLVGIVAMHDHGFAHLDISSENIVLSDDHAYLVDFESVLPFDTMEKGYMAQRDLGVPIKPMFVPPEYMSARGDDLLSLPSFDVWAFGVVIFMALFNEYLFGARDVRDEYSGMLFCMPCERHVAYFNRYGFRKFIKKFHPAKYGSLFHVSSKSSSKFLRACGDLLSRIFRRARPVPVGSRSRLSASVPRYRKRNGRRPRYFCDLTRMTARDIYNHPLWEEFHIR